VTGPLSSTANLLAADGDTGRFWTHLLAALGRTGAVPRGVLSTLQPKLTGADAAFPQLLVAGLERLREPVVLVLDDFHTIATRQLLDAVQQLLRRAPRQLASRGRP
jgi:ATP/maltotriose-dependent transcriptional regulator MalT